MLASFLDDVTFQAEETRFNVFKVVIEVQRTTKYSNYNFEDIEPRLFRLKGNVIKEANMLNKSDEYWASVRQVPLTKKESNMDVFMNRIEQIPGFKYVIFGAKALIENFVERTRSNPSKFDFNAYIFISFAGVSL